MTKSPLTFPKGGVHPRESKELTARLPIEILPLPAEVDILLNQHFGAPAAPVIKKKEEVREGDLVGRVEAGLGADIHASVTGLVAAVGQSPHPVAVSAPSVTIRTNPDAEAREYPLSDWRPLSREELLSKIKDAGIVGAGGAGFPTHVKLAPPEEAGVNLLILNGAECEPYLTSDHRLMAERPETILEGARILMKTVGVGACRIGIEANKPDAIEALSRRLAEEQAEDGFRISVDPLEVKYPQGSEKQLIQSLTGRKVPGFGLPFDVGVIVQNVGTAAAVYDAVARGKPFYERVVTVSGRGIRRPANLQVRIGTRLKDIVDFLGGTLPELVKIVLGGPMMGFAVPSLDIPVTKATSGVLFLTQEEIDISPHSHCIRCGWCQEACPMGLSPNEIGVYVEAGRPEDTSQFGLFECFECGSCAFVCPAKRPLVQFIRLAKMKAKK